jgi:RNA polymerase sigma-70 factor (ECF subfamily)
MTDDCVARVYASSYRRLVGQLFGICGDLAEAEDLVAEAFARAVNHRRAFERADNPEAWLRTVAVNLARSHWRRQQVANRVRLFRDAHAPPRAPLELAEDRAALVAGMRQLTRGQREVLALHYFADLPVHEISATLQMPPGTVKAHLRRGRAALADFLGTPVDREPDDDQRRRVEPRQERTPSA